MSEILTHKLDCGLVLNVQPIPNVASVAIDWLLPVGSAADPADGDGHAAMLSEYLFRGAGGLSSRAFSEAMDRLGVQRSSQVQTHHLRLDAALVGERLAESLPLITALVRDPALPEDALEPVRSLCLQSLESLDDDPQVLVMLHLRRQHRPPPFHRHGYGDRGALERVSAADLRAAWSSRCVPEGSIFSMAGAVDPTAVTQQLNTLLKGWSGQHIAPQATGPAERRYHHDEQDTAQVHIGLAYDAPPEADEHSMLERLATGVLSGSTSGRLFTEVRQKRSLCYSVHASYRAGKDDGAVSLYAGTTPQRAQETLDVSIAEIERMRKGASPEEFNRAVVGLKSRLIMHGESTAARAAALGHDFFRLGRARTLEEISRAIDAITCDDLNAYLAGRAIGPFTITSIGPAPLSVPESQAAGVPAT